MLNAQTLGTNHLSLQLSLVLTSSVKLKPEQPQLPLANFGTAQSTFSAIGALTSSSEFKPITFFLFFIFSYNHSSPVSAHPIHIFSYLLKTYSKIFKS
jgi:hypothetical protein